MFKGFGRCYWSLRKSSFAKGVLEGPLLELGNMLRKEANLGENQGRTSPLILIKQHKLKKNPSEAGAKVKLI